jgi:PKD repeat protein
MDLLRAVAGVGVAIFMMVAPQLGIPYLSSIPSPGHEQAQQLAHVDVQVGDRVGLMTLNAQGNRSALRVLWVEVDGQKLDGAGQGQGQLKRLRFALAGEARLRVGNDTVELRPGDEASVEAFEGKWAFAPDGQLGLLRMEGTVLQARLGDRGLRSLGTDQPALPDGWSLDSQHSLARNVTVRAGRTAFVSTEARAPDGEAVRQLRARDVRLNGERVNGTRWGEGALDSVSFVASAPGVLKGEAGNRSVETGQQVVVTDFIGAYVVFFRGDEARLALEGYAAGVQVGAGAAPEPGSLNRPPVASFDLSPLTPQSGQAVKFVDRSSDPDGRVVQRLWKFGDGQQSSEPSPSHAYDDSGLYTVTLVVTDDHLVASTATRALAVLNRAPVAAFTTNPAKPTRTDSVQFVDQSSDLDGHIVGWRWSFGDGAQSTEQNPQHQFPRLGLFNVSLTVLDEDGGSATLGQLLEVRNLPPTAKFSWLPASPHSGDGVQFRDESTDPDGTIARRQWDFGDGARSDEPNPLHVFLAKGPQRVQLVVTDDAGGTAHQESAVNVLNSPPLADFAVSPDPPAQGVEARFTDLSSDPDGRITEWVWSFGDGSVSGQQSPVHTYAQGGNVSVTLTVKDDDGQRTSVTKLFRMNRQPVAAFTFWPARPTTGTPVSFNDTSVDPDGSVAGWRWDFGDGQQSAERSPVHPYADNGAYKVRLTVTDHQGGTGTLERALNVSDTPPLPDFTWQPEKPSTGETITFTDASTDSDGKVQRWTWEFGDGTGGVGRTTAKRYSAAGTYTVTLVATDDDGSSATKVKLLHVNQAPVAAFTWLPSQPSANSLLQFTDASTDADGTVQAWHWSFGDGAESADRHPQHRFAQPGTYPVRLQVTDNDGGGASVERQLVVQDLPPAADFLVLTQSPRAGQPVQFQDNSRDPDGSLASWLWDFGDGGQSAERSPSHTYEQPGAYTVTLRATDLAGKSGNTSKAVRVFAGSPLEVLLRVVYPDGTAVNLARDAVSLELRELASGARLGGSAGGLQLGPEGWARGSLAAGQWAPGDSVAARFTMPSKQVDQTTTLPLASDGDLGLMVLDLHLDGRLDLQQPASPAGRPRWYADPTEQVEGVLLLSWADGAPVKGAQALVTFTYQEVGFSKQRVDLSGQPGGSVAGESDALGRLPFAVPFTVGAPQGPGSYLPGQYGIGGRATFSAAGKLYVVSTAQSFNEDPGGLRSAL